MFALKLDNQFFAHLNENEMWEYTDRLELATPIDTAIVTELLKEYQQKGFLTFGDSDFVEVSVLELEIIVRKEIKINKVEN